MVLDLSGVASVDSTACAGMAELARGAKLKGISTVVVGVKCKTNNNNYRI